MRVPQRSHVPRPPSRPDDGPRGVRPGRLQQRQQRQLRRHLDHRASTEPVTLRLGYFPNVTHAPAIVGVENGMFAKDARRQRRSSSSRPSTPAPRRSTAILAGALDASVHRPEPGDQRVRRSPNGEAIRIVVGRRVGRRVPRREARHHDAPRTSKGKKIATPQLGNTQDVALRTWLKTKGYETDTEGGGDVSILPQDNAHTLDRVPDRRRSTAPGCPSRGRRRLVNEGGGKVLVDEATLWPDGKYVTTHLIVATEVPRGAPRRRAAA